MDKLQLENTCTEYSGLVQLASPADSGEETNKRAVLFPIGR